MNYFKKDTRNTLQSIEYANQIAYAPLVFQASRTLRTTGLLKIVEDAGKEGITLQDTAQTSGLPLYGVRVLLEAGLGIGLFISNDDKYAITKTGSFLLHDEMTIVNMDFVHDVCYKGMYDLDKSIETGKPEGLKTFGTWNTVYESLAFLPEQIQKSWFAFDHFYSDTSFGAVLPHVFRDDPKRILDIGGNTGKWTIRCTSFSPTVKMGIVDLPGQLNMAKKNLDERGLTDRVSYYELNILTEDAKLPGGYDIIWMSQFLDCFSDDQIVSILKKCFDVLDENGQVFILESLWDRQKFEVSAFCLQMTSLYFTNIANGNSQMYSSAHFIGLIEKAGFKVVEQVDNVGICHTLLKCRKN
jgi:ubiquinone/menaquinone biosynthesis C-methylase UbiE